jgi:hypothetical protein
MNPSRILTCLILWLTVACAAPDKDPLDSGEPEDTGPDTAWLTADDDGDGLSNGEEQDLGTDPGLSDSDGDGYPDGEEVDANTNPLDADDHPYLGGWPIGACRNDVVSTGNEVGDIAEDFELMDQYGEMVRLYDFCDRAVLLVGAAFW